MTGEGEDKARQDKTKGTALADAAAADDDDMRAHVSDQFNHPHAVDSLSASFSLLLLFPF